MSDLIKKAMTFQIAAHSAVGQVRKYTGEPYWTHPISVAKYVMMVTDDEETIVAALLHDVVEDTQVTIEQIEEQFGAKVAEYVYFLTDISKPSDGIRSVRKAIDREHIAKGSAEVHTVKLADLIDNTRSIVAHDPKFAKVYLEEKRLLLCHALTKGDAVLRAEAEKLIDWGFNELKGVE